MKSKPINNPSTTISPTLNYNLSNNNLTNTTRNPNTPQQQSAAQHNLHAQTFSSKKSTNNIMMINSTAATQNEILSTICWLVTQVYY